MSNRAQAYVWRLRVHGKSTPRKFLLVRIADMVSDDSMSCFAKVATIAAYLDIDPRRAKEYLSDLADDGHISVLERTWPDGRQRDSRIFLHGPWDAFGGTGEPFAEITLPKSSKPMDPTQPIKVTVEMREELDRRYSEYAKEFGQLPDGTPRCQWRLGSRAHSITCWYGVSRRVIHRGRPATVASITATDPKGKPLPQEHVQLQYVGDDEVSDVWVSISELTAPAKEENPSSGGGDESVPPGVTKTSPQGVTKTSPQGVTKTSPLESSDEPSDESSSSEAGGSTVTGGVEEEEEESPTAQKTPDAADTVMAHTDATPEEAEAVVDAIEAEAHDRHTKHGTRKVGQIDAYVARFSVRDLSRHLKAVRAQRASQGRTEAIGADSRCLEHHEPLDCAVCDTLPPGHGRILLRRYGTTRRPDLARRYGTTKAHA